MLKKLSGFNLGHFFAFKVAPELLLKSSQIHSLISRKNCNYIFLTFSLHVFQMPAPYNIGDGRKSDSTHPDSLLKAPFYMFDKVTIGALPGTTYMSNFKISSFSIDHVTSFQPSEIFPSTVSTFYFQPQSLWHKRCFHRQIQHFLLIILSPGAFNPSALFSLTAFYRSPSSFL